MKKYFAIVILLTKLQVSALGQLPCPPGAFSITGISNITQTGVLISWSTPDPAGTSFTIYYKPTSEPAWTSGNFVNCTTSTCTSLTQTGLQPGTSYDFYVEGYRFALVGGGDCEGTRNTSQVTAVTLPNIPTGLTATASPTLYELTASWTAAAGAASYSVEYKPSTSGTWISTCANTTFTSCTISSLDGNVTYNVRVRSNTSTNSSGYSDPQSATIIPAVPTPTTATAISQNSFTANWSASTGGAASYTLLVATDAAFTTGLRSFPGITGTSMTVNTLIDAGTDYYYTVRAHNATGASPYSSTIIPLRTSPATPTITAVASTFAREINVSWPAVATATSYDVQYKKSSEGNWTNFCTGTTSTSCLITPLDGNTSYEVKVRANNGTSSPFSTAETKTTIPGIPIPTAATTISQNSFTANWSAPLGLADRYTLQVADNPAFSGAQVFPNITGTSRLVDASPGTTYYYTVKADNATGSSSYASTPTTLVTTPATPVITAVPSILTSEMNVSWPAVPGATSYDVQYKRSSEGNWTNFCTGTTSTSCLITPLDGNTSYDVKVRANNGTSSPFSTPETKTTIPGIPIPTAATLISQTSFTANWSAPLGLADRYTLQVADNPTFSGAQVFSNINGTSRLVDASPGTTYYYTVKADNATGSSSYASTPTTLTTTPATPVITAAPSVLTPEINVSWPAVSGATSYDVQYKKSSEENWTNFCTGTTSTSCLITPLDGNTSYDVKVRANNGTSSPFSTASVRTIPGIPTPVAPATISQNSFTAIWTAPLGLADSYTLQVADNPAFTGAQIFPNITSTSKLVDTSINPGTTYYYTVKADNATGSSSYSDAPTTLLTTPATPVTNVAASTSALAIDVSWSTVLGAATYDVQYKKSSISTWTDICAGTQSTSCSITGLDANTVYNVQVRANNGTSSPFASGSAKTIPNPPTTPLTGTTTSSSFTASWTASTGNADFYQLEVALDGAFTTRVTGYDPLTISGAVTEAAVINLSSSTAYWWRVRAGNSSGTSSFSEIKSAGTKKDDGNSEFKLEYINFSYPQTYDGTSGSIALSVKASFYPVTATLFHKKISESESEFTQTQIVIDGSQNETRNITPWSIEPDWLDEMGVEFMIRLEDNSNQVEEVPLTVIRNRISNWIVSPERFGKSAKDYVIISSPYEMTGNIEDIFEQAHVAGPYDPAKWRLVRFEDGRHLDYKKGLSKSQMTRGGSYWFLSASQITMQFGEVTSPENTADNPFILHLEKGWNQIASPYPYSVDWNDVLEANDNPPGVGNLKVFDPSITGFRESPVLRAFSGGFVLADEAVDLTIPVTVRTDASGRRTNSQDPFEKWPDETAWLVNITVTHDDVVNNLGGVGMHPHAKIGKDQFDEIALPRFVEYAEWNSHHDDYFIGDFTRDIVPTQQAFTWTFTAEHNGSAAPVTLTWNNESAAAAKASIILHDLSSNTLIDLKKSNSYSYSAGNRTFRIYYNAEGIELERDLQLGVPYPNPAHERVVLPFAFSNQEEPVVARLEVFDITGKKITAVTSEKMSAGLHALEWDCSASDGRRVSAGVYFFRVHCYGATRETQTFSGRISVQ